MNADTTCQIHPGREREPADEPSSAPRSRPLGGRLRGRRVPMAAAVLLMATTMPFGAVPAPAVAQVGQAPEPPVAATDTVELTIHGDTRLDPYFWLREREDPEVIRYLEAENAYTEAMTSHTEALREELYRELKGREKQDDASAPQRIGEFFYYTRYEEGKDYPIFARRRGSMEAPEEVLLDENERAGDGYYAAGTYISPDHGTLAFVEDTVGRRFYTVRFKDLATGKVLEDAIPSTTGNLAWANDNRTVFYSRQDPETLRAYQVWRHRIGTDPAADALVYQEDDEEFSTYVRTTRSKEYVQIVSSQTLSTEVRLIDADRPELEPHVFLPRRPDHEYSLAHWNDRFYVLTNSGDAPNYRLLEAPDGGAPGVEWAPESSWKEVIPHRADVLLEGVDAFRNHLVVSERQDGLMRLRVTPFVDGTGGADGTDGAELGESHYVDFGEPAYLVRAAGNPEFDTGVLRYIYSSMTTPTSTIDYDMESRERTVVKRTEVLGGFDPADYRTERLWAEARDGKRVPISVVYRKDTPLDGTAPLLVYGYGSYGASRDASFSSARLSLLDRGFVYAIAHVRGGQELGRQWYEDGKLLNKENTFTDFIDVTEHLVAEGYGDEDRVFAMGGSAGGLLMGAVVNMRPELYEGVIAAVPFVDVVTTMLDESIPLTTFEYDEWGNPNEAGYYRYMLSYSPYDNVTAQAYPNMLVTTGLHDSQVQYWEPAKWVAKLRAVKTGDGVLLLKTNMDAGHGGPSGRDQRYRDTAFQYAFLLDLAGR